MTIVRRIRFGMGVPAYVIEAPNGKVNVTATKSVTDKRCRRADGCRSLGVGVGVNALLMCIATDRVIRACNGAFRP